MGEIRTFVDLYEFLRGHKEESIIPWLKVPWEGKDKQESLLRLFAKLELIPELRGYSMCKGNFNLVTVSILDTKKSMFYGSKNKLIYLNDSGDASDLTGIRDKNLLVTTSKNTNNVSIGKLDIEKIIANFILYRDHGYTMTLCVVSRNKSDVKIASVYSRPTSRCANNAVTKRDTIILDWNVLDTAYKAFKRIYNIITLPMLFKKDRFVLILKPHQTMSVEKTLHMKNKGTNPVLWGHIPRSGKSYIMAGCIIADAKNNYLIITLAPNETIDQYLYVLNCTQLSNYRVTYLNGENKDRPTIGMHNIIICSKQFLQKKVDKAIEWLSDISFDMRFVDESHHGGTTDLARSVLGCYGKDAFTIQITATYTKPLCTYKIPEDAWCLWDLEDIKLCKQNKVIELCQKHKTNAFSTEDSLKDEYNQYPDLWVLTDKLTDNITKDIMEETKDNDFGWSIDSAFLLDKRGDFQNKSEAMKIWYRVFGKRSTLGVPHRDYPEETVYMERINTIMELESQFDKSRLGKVILAFIPSYNINKLTKATIKLFEEENIANNYLVVGINSKISSNPKKVIDDAITQADLLGKDGVLVLSGKQCSLGVSIHECDVVLLLNNTSSFDSIYQSMFRCMTERPGKEYGFVVDMSIHRVINTTILGSKTLSLKTTNPKKIIEYILKNRILTLNGDHWLPSFGCDPMELKKIVDNMYTIHISNIQRTASFLLERINYKNILTLSKCWTKPTTNPSTR